jgi:probable blue pigment (indigoidine) exporter
MVGITVAWAGCFLAIRWGLRDAPVLWFAALRALVAGVALLALVGVQHRPLPRGRRSWAFILALAVTNVTIGFGAMFAGVAGLATGTAAVLANAQPLLILLPAWWFYGEAISTRTAAALAVGFVGLLVVALPGGGGGGGGLSLLAALSITAGTLLARRIGGMDVVAVSAWHFLIGGALLGGLAGIVEGAPEIAWTPRFLVVLAFLSLVGSAAAFVAWFTESLRCRLDVLSAWTFLVPVIGIGLAAVFLGERPGGWTAIGLAAVLVSLWTVLGPRVHRR